MSNFNYFGVFPNLNARVLLQLLSKKQSNFSFSTLKLQRCSRQFYSKLLSANSKKHSRTSVSENRTKRRWNAIKVQLLLISKLFLIFSHVINLNFFNLPSSEISFCILYAVWLSVSFSISFFMSPSRYQIRLKKIFWKIVWGNYGQ